MLKSDHAVVLTCRQAPEQALEKFTWFLLVVALSCCTYVGTCAKLTYCRLVILASQIEGVTCFEQDCLARTAHVGKLAMLPLPNRQLLVLFGSIYFGSFSLQF